MKKRFLIIVLCAITVLAVMTGCGKNEDTEQNLSENYVLDTDIEQDNIAILNVSDSSVEEEQKEQELPRISEIFESVYYIGNTLDNGLFTLSGDTVDGEKSSAVVDCDGKVLQLFTEYPYVFLMSNGTVAVRSSSEEFIKDFGSYSSTVEYNNSEGSFNIAFDSKLLRLDGSVVYENTDNSIQRFFPIDENYVFVWERKVGFDGETFSWGVLDSNGEWYHPLERIYSLPEFVIKKNGEDWMFRYIRVKTVSEFNCTSAIQFGNIVYVTASNTLTIYSESCGLAYSYDENRVVMMKSANNRLGVENFFSIINDFFLYDGINEEVFYTAPDSVSATIFMGILDNEPLIREEYSNPPSYRLIYGIEPKEMIVDSKYLVEATLAHADWHVIEDRLFGLKEVDGTEFVYALNKMGEVVMEPTKVPDSLDLEGGFENKLVFLDESFGGTTYKIIDITTGDTIIEGEESGDVVNYVVIDNNFIALLESTDYEYEWHIMNMNGDMVTRR